MATGVLDPNAIVPQMKTVSVGTTAARLQSSSVIAVKFSLTNPGSVPVYIGSSSVSSTVYMLKLAAASTVTFGPDEIIGGRQKVSYDLAGFYTRATAAGQTAILTLYVKSGTTSPF